MCREGILSEPEFLCRYGVADVCCFHVFAHQCDGYVEVEIEREDGTGQKHDKDREGSVLEVSNLNLHRTELNTPTHVRTSWRWLEAHVLPVG